MVNVDCVLFSPLLCFLLFFSLAVFEGFVCDRQLDFGCHRCVIAFHVNLSRYVSIFAVLEQGSVREYVVELPAVFFLLSEIFLC